MNVSLTNGVHEVQEGVPFRLFLVNFSDEVVCLPVGQSVARVLPGQPRAYPTPLRLADVLGIDPIDVEGDSSKENCQQATEPLRRTGVADHSGRRS